MCTLCHADAILDEGDKLCRLAWCAQPPDWLRGRSEPLFVPTLPQDGPAEPLTPPAAGACVLGLPPAPTASGDPSRLAAAPL